MIKNRKNRHKNKNKKIKIIFKKSVDSMKT